jgi:poly [ADP-ribose] polymerase
MSIVYSVNLVKSDPEMNNNKFWKATVYDDGSVVTRNGRIGEAGQTQPTKQYANADIAKNEVLKIVAKKKKPKSNGEIGYREIDIVNEDCKTVTISNNTSNLVNIAKKQIKSKKGSPETIKLIEDLTKINIHNITSFSSQFTYNYDKNMFQTPMGLLTEGNINSAKEILNQLSTLDVNTDSRLLEFTRDYFMLVPQDLGRGRLDYKSFWSEKDQLPKQFSILDSLLSSVSTASTTKDNDVEELVFQTEMELLSEKAKIKEIFDVIYENRDRRHSCYNYKPINIWEVHIAPMADKYVKHSSSKQNKIMGFHGTGSENILSLLKTGFLVRPPKNAHIAGKMFGNGIYTAPYHVKGSSTKALNYAVGYWGNTRKNDRTFMFICDVAMGKFHTPSGPITRIPSGYDSCWAKANVSSVINDECIVYDESQINIKYLVEMKS